MRPLLATLFLIFTSTSHALVASDEEYYVFETNRFEYILSKENFNLLPKLIFYGDELANIYESEFNWTLDEKPRLVIASDRNQVANGFATFSPNLRTVFYSGGSPFVEQFSGRSWLESLLLHETAHLYQISAKSKVSSAFFAVQRNVIWNYFVFTFPNFLTPTLFMEGNATFNESRFNNGGRLYTGPNRALTLALIKDKKTEPARLINDHVEFPYGREKYLVGGHLFAHINQVVSAHETKKERKLNALFKNQSDHWFNPLILGSTFRKTYGLTYRDLIKDFNERWIAQAKAQKTSSSPELGFSITEPKMNRIGDEIVYFTTNGKEKPLLNRFNTKTEKIESTRADYSVGKVFDLDDKKYWVATSFKHSPTSIKYSLYGEGMELNKDYINKYIFDFYKSTPLYLNITESMDEPILYSGSERIGPAHSHALYNGLGEPVYFKQDGDRRSLYVGRRREGSFKGDYGQLVDVIGTNYYFIGATAKGSSLFRIKGNRTERLSDSDTIVTAKQIQTGKFLVAEVGSKGYTIRQISTQKKIEKPAVYEFGLKNTKVSKVFDKVPTTTSEMKPKPYSPIRNMRVSRFFPFLGFSTGRNSVGSATLTLADPLTYNSTEFNYGYGSHYLQRGSVTYTNSKNRLAWSLGVGYREEGLLDDTDPDDVKLLDKGVESYGLLGLTYPIHKKGRWSSRVSSQLLYDLTSSFGAGQTKEYAWITSIGLNKSIPSVIGWGPIENFDLNFTYSLTTDAPEWKRPRHTYTLASSYSQNLGYETYLGFSALATRDDNSDASILSGPFVEEENLSEAATASLGLEKAINWSLYSDQIPLGLRRLALAGFVQYIYGGPEKSYGQSSAGLTFELLLAHRIPFRVGLFHYFESVASFSENRLQIGYEKSF